jgi:hypothetical protein
MGFAYHRNVKIIDISPLFGLGLWEVDINFRIVEWSLIPDIRQHMLSLVAKAASFASKECYPC